MTQIVTMDIALREIVTNMSASQAAGTLVHVPGDDFKVLFCVLLIMMQIFREKIQ